MVDLAAVRGDLFVEVGVGGAQVVADSGLVRSRFGRGAVPGRIGSAENPQQRGIALGDVDFHAVALEPRGGGCAMGLAGDHLFQRLVAEEGRHGEQTGDHGDRQAAICA